MQGQNFIIYKFFFSDTVKKIELKFDNDFNLIWPKKERYPYWVELKNFKCPNCSLETQTDKYCPVAIIISDIIEEFKNFVSYTEVDIEIETRQRNYTKHTSLQKGLSSLLGLCMASSSCPILSKLKPLSRFHLPFSTIEETSLRVVSLYLLAQSYCYRNNKEPDLKLEKLKKLYKEISIVNKNICDKISKLNIKDSIINAVINLNCFNISVQYVSAPEFIDKIKELIL